MSDYIVALSIADRAEQLYQHLIIDIANASTEQVARECWFGIAEQMMIDPRNDEMPAIGIVADGMARSRALAAIIDRLTSYKDDADREWRWALEQMQKPITRSQE